MVKRRGPKSQNKISLNWSPKLSYSVGLLATDGNLSNDGRHIDLTSKDKGQIINFRNCLGLHNNKIGKKTSGYTKGKNYYRIQFSNSEFYKWLVDIGITPKKSHTINTLKIPDKYFFDFLRGCFDGDGCIYSFWDPRWRSSYMFYTVFVSASSKFLEWLQKSTTRLAKARGRITKSTRVYQLRFAKKESLVLINKMFYSPNIHCLKRKYLKIQRIIKQARNGLGPDGGIGLRSGLRGRAS